MPKRPWLGSLTPDTELDDPEYTDEELAYFELQEKREADEHSGAYRICAHGENDQENIYGKGYRP